MEGRSLCGEAAVVSGKCFWSCFVITHIDVTAARRDFFNGTPDEVGVTIAVSMQIRNGLDRSREAASQADSISLALNRGLAPSQRNLIVTAHSRIASVKHQSAFVP